MTLPTASENARLSWGDEPHSVPDDDRVKMLSMQHAVQATERRDKDIARELREILFVPKIMTEKEKEEQVSKLVKLIEQLEDGEKVSR